MTAPTAPRLPLADATEAADLAAFLERLLRFDRAAAVRLQAVRAEQGPVLAVFGRLPLGSSGVLAVRSARLFGAAVEEADLTVSAGQLLEGVDEAGATVWLPAPVTGPAWAGLLPPRSRWERIAATTAPEVMPELMAAVREFKQRSAGIPEHHRTRPALDALADEIWSRPLTAAPALPLRAAHAAYVIGFLTPGAALTAHRSGSWLRLSAPAGSVALRGTAVPGSGLGLSPLR
ncbi:hypothetical protein [Kitasatospora sp. NPDC002040]|uniref:hypothetical protein n=1 Tax=Kitasatospora sp. NPDC002040 TaxID=3154661 RepID=UPI003319009C